MLVGPFILGIHRIGNGQNGLIAHFQLSVFQLDFSLLFFKIAPFNPVQNGCRHPDAKGHGHQNHIKNEPGIVVDFLCLDNPVQPFLEDVLPSVVKHRQMQGVRSCRQVRILNGAQFALHHGLIFGIKTFQLIPDIQILNGIVDDLRKQFKPSHAPVDHDRLAVFDPPDLLAVVQPNARNGHPVAGRMPGIPVRINDKQAGVAGQEQISLSVIVIPGIDGQRAGEARLPVEQVIGQRTAAKKQVRPVHHINAGAAHDKQLFLILCPDIIVVVVRETIQKANGRILIHETQAVAGDHKHAL